MGRQHQLQPTIAAWGSSDRELPSQETSNLPRMENLVVATYSSVIPVDDWMQVRNLFGDTFCLAQLAVWGANGKHDSHKQTTKNHWPIKQPRSSGLSKSVWIAVKQTTHLRMVGLPTTDQTIDQRIDRTRAWVQTLLLRSELVKSLN